MLNTEMRNDLTNKIDNLLHNIGPLIEGMDKEGAFRTVAAAMVGVFAAYVDFDDDEADSLSETLAILNDPETMNAIAEAEAEINEGHCESCLYSLDGEEDEGCDDCFIDTDELLDTGDVVWYDSVEAALAANV